jgi:diguanylate cyclase (GGDEF)-like protein
MPPEAIGYRMTPGSGLVGKVAERDEPLISNDYQGLSHQADPALFGEFRSCIAVPMHWAGSLRGVLAVYYKRPYSVTPGHLSLLETFGELAAAACRNASAHAGLAQAARTDGLTGCLNHAAMHDSLRREIERCERTGHRLSLVLVDMDDFKQVNEEHGHLMGDEVLRRVGEALRHAVRPYDLVARYGGDEFAILAVESDELEATELAGRAVTGVSRSLEDLQEGRAAGGASAGIAEWSPGEIPTGLIERADRALMYGKREHESGSVIASSTLPGDYRPAPARAQGPSHPGSAPSSGGWPARYGRAQTERLRRRTRQLAVANEVGTRLAGMTKPATILRSAVGELERALGYSLSAVIRVRDDGYVDCPAGRGQPFSGLAGSGWAQPSTEGLIGRCLSERRPVRSGEATEITSGDGPAMASELVVPLWVGEELWGAVTIQDPRADAFDEDDGRLIQTVADQIGSALRSAMLYERLEGAYLGTAEALAAAVESKDSYTAGHSRTVVSRAQQVGARLGLGEQELQTLRLASIFHDIGKVGVPETILNKRGPLTPSERREIECHTVVGERILSTVDFLADVLPLVRHEHERWDGKGYPDGLRGEDIPLGSRIILACDAYSAMISDRPYRPAMSDSQAGTELLAGAGTQFDERVVAALLQLLESPAQTAVNSDR